MQVCDTFRITDRGLVVMVNDTTDLPVGRRLSATVVRPDGRTIETDAFKEWVLRYTTEALENECFLLIGLNQDDVPIGSVLHLTDPG